MRTGIWHLTGLSLLCMSISAQVLADSQPPRSEPNESGQRDIRQQLYQQRSVERQQQQQINQQQREQQRQINQQQNQVRQAERQQQQQIQQQEMQQRSVERQQQQQINQVNRDQQRQIQQQQNQQRQIERQQLRQAQDNLPIQSGPREAWQTQPPRQGYYRDIPRDDRNWRPNDRWEGRPDGHGNGWGPGPQYRPGHLFDRVPGNYSRIPWRGQEYFYADGYWYRPQNERYVVVTPPYGARVRSLPSYSREIWVGSSLLFLAAGTYYTYQPDTQEYVVVTPPADEAVYEEANQGNGYDPVAWPQNGQSPQQVELDHYQCYRWAADESGFDPATVTYEPAPQVVDQYRRSMGACLVQRGYSVQ